MTLTLIEGPAGSGKSQIVADMLAANELDVVADLTARYGPRFEESSAVLTVAIRSAQTMTLRSGPAWPRTFGPSLCARRSSKTYGQW